MSGNCLVYSDLRSQFGDLREDKNLVNYFRAVLNRRDTLEEEDRTWQQIKIWNVHCLINVKSFTKLNTFLA